MTKPEAYLEVLKAQRRTHHRYIPGAPVFRLDYVDLLLLGSLRASDYAIDPARLSGDR